MYNRGNALFLILIAVALFAALSYAVTQSGRGGGSVDKEQAVIAAAQITQWANSVRNAFQRMTLTGTAASSIIFCSTGDADNACNWFQASPIGIATLDPCETGATCIFAPEGGGVVLPPPMPAAALTGSTQWDFFEADGMQTNMQGVGAATGETVLILERITKDVCEAIARGFGHSLPIATDAVGGDFDGYSGEAAKCTDLGGGGVYNFFLALVER